MFYLQSTIFISAMWGLGAASVAMMVCMCIAPDDPNKALEFGNKIPLIAIVVGCIAAAAAYLYRDIKRKKDLPMIYYKTCVESNITSLSTAIEKERAFLIAKNNFEFEYFANQYEIFFEKGKIQHEAFTKAQQTKQSNEKLEQAKQEALSTRLQLEKYAEYIGREKRIRMLDDKRYIHIEEAKAYRKSGNSAFSMGQQKELSWALAGGVASGIAGPAAGLAAASHAQAENMQIRQQNQENRALAMPLVATAYNEALKCDSKAAKLQCSIEATRLKLVGDVAPEKLLKQLQFSDIKSSFTALKALSFIVKVSLLSEVIIFDTVSAVIDGTIKANIFQDEKYIGSALMSFPTYGIGSTAKPVVLKGICLGETFDISAPITVKYEPYHLWAMEK